MGFRSLVQGWIRRRNTIAGAVAIAITGAMGQAAAMDTNRVSLPWSFHPVIRPELPRISSAPATASSNPIDVFIAAGLEKAGLEPNPPASRRSQLRRLSLDVLGLPPTYEEIQDYEADTAPDAWQRRVEIALSRPEYGERWARHWLDVVRFAQSNGYERDGEKLFAWRYRDYVVQSLNADKPYDQFVREQIAGDELKPWTAEGVIATGFARLGVLDDEPDDAEQAVFDELDDVVSTTGVAFLGLTLGCARCHEHKFDPITHADYYRVLAFFRGVEPGRHGADLAKSTAHVPLVEPEVAAAWRRQRTESLQRLEAELAMARDGETKKQLTASLNQLRNTPPPFESALAVVASEGETKPTHVLKRGDPRQLGAVVEPGFLAALNPSGGDSSAMPGTSKRSRRSILADWIASPENPWTARVIVNRVWQHYFGTGLVRTTGDFGRAGVLPSHPELLDWLASELVARGWSLKWLHRVILTSDVYRRSSTVREAAEAVDPGNRWLWRQHQRRLEAEAIRDSLLFVSGQLNRVPGGRGFFPELSGDVLEGGSRPGTDWEISTPAERSRRSLYAYIRRTQMIPFFETLDYANVASPMTERPVTTVAPQALLLLNDAFVHEQAAAMARVVERRMGEAGAMAQNTARRGGFIRAAFQQALGRVPSDKELAVAEAYLGRQRQNFAAMAHRLLFRSRVPGTMNTAYFDRLDATDFVQAPPGWKSYRGHWPDTYEGNRIMRRGQGPYVLWEDRLPPEFQLSGTLVPHTAFESGGLLLCGQASGEKYAGLELYLDVRQQRLRVLRHGADTSELGSIPCQITAGAGTPVRVERRADRLQVWSGAMTEALEIRMPSDGLGTQLGVRTWGAALSVDDLRLRSLGQGRDAQERLLVDPGFNPDQRALEAVCLLLLNLNELIYVE